MSKRSSDRCCDGEKKSKSDIVERKGGVHLEVCGVWKKGE